MTSPVRIEYDTDGDLAVVVLDKPPLNLFDEAVFTAWEQVVDELAAVTDPARPGRARAVLVEARGNVVSGGVDVAVFAAIAESPGAVQDAETLFKRLLRIVQALEDLPVPTVFAAHGLTLTAAFEIALACDILLAAKSATFGLVETVVGLTPSMGGPQRLAERAGPARARELIYTGERYAAATLERWNVVNRVLPDEGFTEAAREYARRVAAGPTCAHAATKRLVATAVRERTTTRTSWSSSIARSEAASSVIIATDSALRRAGLLISTVPTASRTSVRIRGEEVSVTAVIRPSPPRSGCAARRSPRCAPRTPSPRAGAPSARARTPPPPECR
ncbi:Carnitinyl-CoA dehydratase [Streptomyces aurantiogriseus]